MLDEIFDNFKERFDKSVASGRSADDILQDEVDEEEKEAEEAARMDGIILLLELNLTLNKVLLKGRDLEASKKLNTETRT